MWSSKKSKKMGYKKNDERTNGYETFSISFQKKSSFD